MEEFYFEIPEVDVNLKYLVRTLLNEEKLHEQIQKWEPGSNRIFWNLPLYDFTEELNPLFQQFNLVIRSPRLFVFRPFVISQPHRDNRHAAFNICLAGNSEKDPTYFYDDNGKRVGQLNYELGRVFCLNVSKLHSGQSVHSRMRALLSLTPPSEFTYDDLLDLYKKGKLIRKESTLQFFYRSKENSHLAYTKPEFKRLRDLLKERLGFEHEFFPCLESNSDDVWFAFGYRMQDAERFHCVGNLFTVLSMIENRFKIRVVDLLSSFDASIFKK